MTTALTRAVIELEQHVAETGWDQPPRLFALVDTVALADAEPALAASLGIGEPGSQSAPLTSIEQEGLSADEPLDELLARITWPEAVLGAAVVLERLMLPPTAEDELPETGDIDAWAAARADREEVRIAVAVTRDGDRDTALRLRSRDTDDAVLSGADLVPNLARALAETLRD